jgi:hypothetical protein
MPIVWPGTLPASPNYGWVETKLSNVVRSETDAGPAKVRRRYTRANRKMSLSMHLTTAQVATLDTFHTTTLADGTLRFDFVHPRTGATNSVRFASDGITWTEQAEGFYLATFDLEWLV